MVISDDDDKTPLSEKFKWPSSSLKTTDNPPPQHHNPLFRSSMEPECLPNVCTAGTFYDSVNTKKEATKMLSSNIPGVLL